MKLELVNIRGCPYFDVHMHSVEHGPSAMKNFSIKDPLAWVDNCVEKGLKTACLTEHVPLPRKIEDPTPDKDCSLSKESFIEILLNKRSEIKDYAKEKGLKVFIGGEYDYFPGSKDFYLEFDKLYKPEVKLLGIHFVDFIDVELINDFDVYKEKLVHKKNKAFCFDYSKEVFDFAIKQVGSKKITDRYFEILSEAINNIDYDIIAHIDLINKYNYDEISFKEDKSYFDNFYSILEIIKNKDIAIEINLGGTHYKERLVPKKEIIQFANKIGVPITLGSDAHSKSHILSGWDLAIKELEKIGITQIAKPI